MHEVYTALQANSRRLALMGSRTLIDLYMSEKVGNAGGFESKLQKLVTNGHLSVDDRQILSAALEAGHAASHRGHNPTAVELEHVMDIVENLLQKIALSSSAEKLTDSMPRRT